MRLMAITRKQSSLKALPPLQNVLTMYREAGSLMQDILKLKYDLEGSQSMEIDLSKIFWKSFK